MIVFYANDGFPNASFMHPHEMVVPMLILLIPRTMFPTRNVFLIVNFYPRIYSTHKSYAIINLSIDLLSAIKSSSRVPLRYANKSLLQTFNKLLISPPSLLLFLCLLLFPINFLLSPLNSTQFTF